MIKFYIPILLSVTIVIAGVFAFVPVEQASTVHTTILEGSMNLVTVTATSTANDDDFIITCPSTSDACLIKEIYVDDDLSGSGGIDPGPATIDIDGLGTGEAAFTIASDTGAESADLVVIALSGVANLALGPDAVLRIEMTMAGNGFPYTITVIAEVEGNEVITVARIGNTD